MKKLIFVSLIIFLFSCEKDTPPPKYYIPRVEFCWKCTETQGSGSASYILCKKTEKEIKQYVINGPYILIPSVLACVKQ